MLNNVVIVAGGKNSRFGSLAKFPKLLMPINGTDSILTYDYNMFKRIANRVIVIINQDYYDMMNEYVDNLSLGVEVYKSTNCNGSANTIRQCILDNPIQLEGSTLFLWSDLILERDALEDFIHQASKKSPKVVYGLFELDYRLGIDSNNKLSTFAHNLPGIYFFNDVECLVKNAIDSDGKTEYEDYDLASLIAEEFEYDAIPYTGKLYEYRDRKAFIEHYLSAEDENDLMKTRFFNQITINNDGSLIKKCINPYYDFLIRDEVDWYKETVGSGVTPKIVNFNTKTPGYFIRMEYLKGKPLHTRILKGYKNSVIDVDVLKETLAAIKKLHGSSAGQTKNTCDLEKDFKLEYYDKPINRVLKVKDMISNFNEFDLKYAVTEAFDYIFHNSSNVYRIIHGDLNGSNIIYCEDGKIKFIDSRGHFGNSKLYGPVEYDYAKLLYCLSGYDSLNTERLVYDPLMDKAYTKQAKDILNAGAEIISSKTGISARLLKLIVGTIYISLTSYIGQDVLKANFAYDKGMAIIKDELSIESSKPLI